MARQRKPTFARARRPRAGLWAALAIGVLLGAYVAVLANTRPDVDGDRLRFDSFVDLVTEERITTATILDQDAFVVGDYVRDDGTAGQYNTPYLRDSRERLLGILLDNGVPTTIEQQFAKSLLYPATLLLPALIVVVVFVYLIVSYSRGSGLFAIRSGARRLGSQSATARFSDVAGQDDAIAELREIRDFLAEPGRYAALGAAVPKGILLFGPPGCGKTLLARAVAGEAGAAFYSISGSDFVELYVGVGAARVRELFREARESAPAIVFIDELDSVGRRRGGAPGSGEEQEQALNQILSEMDGFSVADGVIVIAATNRPDVLDPALLRPGRFDRTIGLDRPDQGGRLTILELHARGKPLDASVDLDTVARRSVGLNGADLASVMNEGALLAARAGRSAIVQDDLDEALRRILDAPERQRRLSMRSRGFGRVDGRGDRVTFADVAGVEEVLDELAEVSAYLTEPERYIAIGARPPRGFLLVGPPGCGKTLLARALASEANAAFFSVAATEFVEVFVGEGAGRVRDLFAEARALAPSIVFLDEIDAIGARRGVSEGQREREQTLNQILVELDGFEARTGVIVIAASNRPEILDPALVRPGRFDRVITLALPALGARRAILGLHARGKRLDPSVDLDAVARSTQGMSGADLANLLNEAALLAARRGDRSVTPELVERAAERVVLGITASRRLTESDRRVIAYHEAGHALVRRALPGCPSPRKVSIVARGDTLGAVWNDASDSPLRTREAMLDDMAALLGGRLAEELVFGEPSSAAADDLARVDAVARQMVCILGMGDDLPRRVYLDAGVDGPPGRVSDHAAGAIDLAIGRLIEEATSRAVEVLRSSRPALDTVAAELVAQETISGAQLEELVARAGTDRDDRRSAPMHPQGAT
ncbi:MAG TPA: AAA family ATPase [Acidimicrobiales bacterium]|jgi:ATP-dependent metalloprotease FtsH|nr:AAA family ATPase [Acidimicrobiales bacterium]